MTAAPGMPVVDVGLLVPPALVSLDELYLEGETAAAN
ncbi:MAG: hypothetical protein J07HX5_00072 [halophilic archaeon J07HX5]|nr:MAG: hypothetical protein J07HX5_00072 [halophilic archaeon J07HX5]